MKRSFRCTALLLFVTVAGSTFAATGGNRPSSSPNVTGRIVGDNFLYWTRFVAPVSGTVDSIGGWFRDNDDGSDLILLVLHDTTGSTGTLPGAFLDSTDRVTVSVGGGFGSFAEVVAGTKVHYSVVSGKKYMVGVYGITATGNCYVARDNSAAGNYLTDSTFTLNTSDPLPLADPIGASTKNAETAFTLFVVINAGGGGGGGGSGPRVMVRPH